MDDSSARAVAIVGLGAVLPDAPNAPAFWQNICNKRYSIIEVPPERWDSAAYYDPDPAAPDKTYSKIGSWVRGFEFDWKRFRVPPKVAAVMDEGQQWAVTIAAEALADYGYPERPLDLERTGVILGTAMGGEQHYLTTLRISYPELAGALSSAGTFRTLPRAVRESILDEWHAALDRKLPPITEDTMPGELPNIVAGRVANVLNLRGPNFITDAACASSFAAINAAVELLVQGHADAVITGGVDRNMGASIFVKFCKIGALSATGSRPFGEGADGFVMGEGSAAFMLKRLADAERDGDRIYAVIRGVGASSDGKGKGITAPNPVGQILSVRRAWEHAGLDPTTATLVEAHGTSTRVGDVAEVESLAAVFGSAPRGRIALGSAKSNIGHLKAGAGAAGLLKTTLALHHKLLPPTLNALRPNPAIDFAATPFFLNHELQEWPRANGTPRRAGVSAYGFGGTNFHLVMEEYVPGLSSRSSTQVAGVAIPAATPPAAPATPNTPAAPAALPTTKPPVRGLLALGATTPADLAGKIEDWMRRAATGETPPQTAPDPVTLAAPERLMIDFGDAAELADRLGKARKAHELNNVQTWRAMQAQGIFRGSGPRPGKIAFLFPGQGSQYANMGRELAAVEPTVAQLFAEADRVMTPILGKPLTNYIFVDGNDPAALAQAERDLMQTAITQPAMLTMDMALARLLADYGLQPDMVMGHSLGEYGALIAAGIMPFAHALEAAAARGSEMTRVSMDDNGWMAAVFAPLDAVQKTLSETDGYVVAANINSYGQAVIGGASRAVEEAIARFTQQGFRAMRIPVSHAFHTRIVAPASAPLRQVLDRLTITPPHLPLVANVTGDFYPTTVDAIKEMLEQQIASPVQWVKGLETLYNAGVRTFVEVGPKKALKGFVDDVLGSKPEVWSLFTNHPKVGELQTFNHALCGLYAAGYGVPTATTPKADAPITVQSVAKPHSGALLQEEPTMPAPLSPSLVSESLGQVLAQALQQWSAKPAAPARFDRNDTPLGSIVISGTGLGLPGANKAVMDPDNALRILRGEQFVDLIPARFRQAMVDKRITRLVKGEDGSGHFELIGDTDEVVKLAGRAGSFDLSAEYGVPEKLVEALDTTTQLAMAAGLDALREAGIPLVQTYRRTTKGTYLPDRTLLPEPLRDETGVIFASAFPGGDRFVSELRRYFTWQNRTHELELLEDLRGYSQDPSTLTELARRAAELREQIEAEPYEFDRRFVFRILAMGHSQFAEYIGARGPNTHVNAACAATAQAIALAEDWIRDGRCRRVIVVGADNVTSDNLMEWIGSGFLSVGAVATDDRVEDAVLPFDRRRHGTLLGMGACALVVESEDAIRERGMRGIVELLSSETANSAYHGTRLDVEHISQVMDRLVTAAERRFGLNRYSMAAQTVFMSHETFTPARGGSAAAEVVALRNTFGDAANDVIVANTKGFTGHPMGVGVEDVIAVKILEYGIVPPVPNFREVDPELGVLNLSRGGRYPVQYALHLAAGFGSQIAMTLLRRIPGNLDRVDQPSAYRRWLADVSGYDQPETTVIRHVLTIQTGGAPNRPPLTNHWQPGTGPSLRAAAPGNGAGEARPLPHAAVRQALSPLSSTPRANGESHAPVAPVIPTPPPAAPKTVPTPAVAQPTPVAPAPPAFDSAPSSGAVLTTPPSPSAASAAPAAPEQSAAAGAVADQVLAVVAQKTGYPSDMLDLELDLEADLGIDTVKQAETFAAIREAFAIPQQEGLNLRDYPTLAAVIRFVYEMRPDLAAAAVTPSASRLPQPASEPVSVPSAPAPASAIDPVVMRVLAIVAEKTGYPAEMLALDLDLEADLGIDTVKQAETFAAIREAFTIPQQEGLNLRDYPTLAAVIGFVHNMRPDLAQAQVQVPAVNTVPSTPAAPPQAQPAQTPMQDPVVMRVLAIVAEKTGYPAEMLELDLDLEADLGIDTVKQAETFAAIREAYAIPQQEGLNLRDYPTLAAVIGFVHNMRPDLRQSQAPAVNAVPSTPAAPPQAQPVQAPTQDPVVARVLAIVAEKTGYPAEMLELELDLEADLGIDTVKQAETFASIREAYAIPLQEGLNLRDYPTLAAVVQFVRTMRPDLDTPTPPTPPAASAPAPDNAPAEAAGDPVMARVLEIVADKTGYPADMLEPELDLEADLGVDTVKQAETFATIRESFAIPFQEGLNLRDYPTLAAVAQFVHTMRPDLSADLLAAAPPAAASAPPVPAAPTEEVPAVDVADVSAADALPRRVPVPLLRPSLDLCKPTGVTLDAGSRVLVMLDQGGVGKALVGRLEKRGVTVLTLHPSVTAAELESQLQTWLAQGPIQGVYWLPALDVEPPLEAMDAATWHDLNQVRIKNFYTTMRALAGMVRGAAGFLVAATRLGGLHGYGEQGASAPLGGAVSGFAKAYAMEQRLAGAPCLVKVVDFEPGRKTAEPADLLLAETLTDPGVMEVGYHNGLRFTVTLVEQPVRPDPSIQLGPETVFLVTGAAGGITSAIIADLAAASHGTFYLLDLAPVPAAQDTEIGLLRRDPELLKQHFIEAARAAGERPTPAAINRKLADVERRDAALRAVEAVQAAGGTAYYTSLDLRDGSAAATVMETIRSRHGRLDVLIHAAGLLVDRTLADKEPAQFNLVYDVKADGFYHLLHAAQGMPIGATVAFSSVAGRFGNNGQTDYSAANDLLCKLTSSLRVWRPDTRGLVIDWTAWASIGMAARGSVPQIMDSLGVDMLPPNVGIPTVRRELLAGSRGEVLVAGRLGPWMDELDPTGGLDVAKAAAVPAAQSDPTASARTLTAAGRYAGLSLEIPLDPKQQPFLFDHAPDPGVPWLPGVMAVEVMAEAAALSAPGYTVAAVEDVQMLGAFKFFRMEPRTLYLQAQVTAQRADELVGRMALRSQTPPAREGLPTRIAEHFQARVRLVPNSLDATQVDFALPDALPISAEHIYSRFFHGPAYQVIERGMVEADRAVTLLRTPLPADSEPAGAAWRMAPRLVELCFQTVALWSLEQKGVMALPAGIGRVTVYRQLADAGDTPLYAVAQPHGDGATFSAQVVDAAGQVYVDLQDFRTVARPA